MNTKSLPLLIYFIFSSFVLLAQDHVSLAKVKKGDHYGYIDDNGKEIIPCEFDYISSTVGDGLIAAYKDRNWAYYDVKGRKVLDLGNQYNYCGDFSEGLAAVSNSYALLGHYDSWEVRNKDTRFINRNGKEVFQVSEEFSSRISLHYSSTFKNGLLNVQIPDPGGRLDGIEQLNVFLNRQGEMVIPPLFGEEEAVVYEFQEGLGRTIVWGGGKDSIGFVNKQGDWVIPPKYQFATPFQNGVSMVKQKRKGNPYYSYFLIDKKGNSIFPDSIDCEEEYFEELVAIHNGSKYALAKTDGTILTEFKYQDLKLGKVCVAKLDDRFLFLDRNGQVLQETDYIYADGFQDGLCIVVKDRRRGLTGVVNTKKEVIVPLQAGVNFYICGGVILKYYDEVPDDLIDFQHFNRRGEHIDLSAYDKISYYQYVQIP
ncbi:MAG: WG repeat-containing protein [Bacteroidota bacterium]